MRDGGGFSIGSAAIFCSLVDDEVVSQEKVMDEGNIVSGDGTEKLETTQ